jgi:hypothetical protein
MFGNDEVMVSMPRTYWEWMEGQLRAEANEEEYALLPVIGYDEEQEREAILEMADNIRAALEVAYEPDN